MVKWSLTMAVVISLFLNLGAADLTLMEARNFVAAREMVTENNWLLPTMNGELRLAKPPLPTWLTALAGMAVGDIGLVPALRFPAALMAALMVLFTFLLARQLSRDPLIPLLAAAVLATSFAFVHIGRQGNWDIYCHSFMTGAIWLFVWGCRQPGTSYGLFLGCGLLAGFSFLSKGPVSFYALALPFLLAFWHGFGSHHLGRQKKGLAAALLTCLIVSLSWPLYVYLQVPEALAASAAGETSAWLERHRQPFWFYWSFPVETGIWTLLATAALVAPYARPRISRFGNYRFLASWVVLSVLLLSIIPEKKERYLLPILLPLALLTAHYLRYLVGAYSEGKYTRADHRLLAATVILLALAAAASPYFIYRFVYLPHYLSGWQATAAAACMLVLGATLLYCFIKKRPDLLVWTMVWLQVTVFAIGIPPYFGRGYATGNYQSLQEVRKIEAVKNLKLYAPGGMSMKLIWEVGKPVDSLDFDGSQLALPPKLPAAIFSPTPLEETSFTNTSINLQLLSSYHYDKRAPRSMLYLYRVSQKKHPGK